MLRLISQPNCVRSERSSYLECRNTVIACTGSYLSQNRSDWRYQGIYGIRETCWTYLCILCGSNKQSSMHTCYILAWTDPFISSIESNQRDYGIRGHDGHVWAHTIWPRHISMHAWTLHFCMPGSITLPDCRDKGMYGILWRGRRPWKEAKASYRGWRPPNSCPQELVRGALRRTDILVQRNNQQITIPLVLYWWPTFKRFFCRCWCWWFNRCFQRFWLGHISFNLSYLI